MNLCCQKIFFRRQYYFSGFRPCYSSVINEAVKDSLVNSRGKQICKEAICDFLIFDVPSVFYNNK